MSITASDIAKLREQTGAGIMDVKKALEEASGDFDKATEILRKSGAAKAQKKAAREAREGIVVSYIHGSLGKVGVLLELNCETDFVAKNEEFKAMANEIAMQIAAMNPTYIKEEDVPAEVIEKERSIYAEQDEIKGKPEDIAAKIIDGKLVKFYEEVVLLNQSYIKDGSKTIKSILEEGVQKFGENIQVGKFARFSIEQGATYC